MTELNSAVRCSGQEVFDLVLAHVVKHGFFPVQIERFESEGAIVQYVVAVEDLDLAAELMDVAKHSFPDGRVIELA